MDPLDPTKCFSGLGLLAGFKPNALHGLLNSIRPSDDALPPLPPMAFNALTPSSLPPMTLYDALVASPPVMPPFNALADLPPLPAAMTPYMTPPSPMTPYEPAQLPSVAEIIADIVRAEEERAARILPDWRRRHGWINSFGSIDVT